MPALIDYYLSLASPWCYLGHARLAETAMVHKAQIALKPVDPGAIFAASGGVPLAKRPPQRQRYRLVELNRWSDFLGVPVNPNPAHFPVDDALAAQLVIAADRHGRDAYILADRIMRALWAEDKDIADPATLAAIADACGIEGEAFLGHAREPEMADARRAFTEEAIARHVFGVPTYVFEDEPYWGQDRLDFLDRALADKAPPN